MLTRWLFVIAFAAMFSLTACSASTVRDDGDAMACAECISGKGTVRYSNIEGGFFYIEADDGAKYDPYGLPKAFAQEGLRVRFTVRPLRDRAGFHMMGIIVELVDIRPLDEAPSPRPGSRNDL